MSSSEKANSYKFLFTNKFKMENCEIRFMSLISTDKPDILNIANATLKTDDGHSFTVHKGILAKSNEYFYRLFCEFDAVHKSEFLIRNVAGEILSDILVYLYTGRTCLTAKNIIDVVVGAHHLQADGLLKKVEESVKNVMTVDNCIPILFHAHRINSAAISNEAFLFIKTHFDAVVTSQKAQLAELDLEVLDRLLSSKLLSSADERPLWSVITEWVQKDLQGRLYYVPRLLNNLVRKEVDKNLIAEILGHSIVVDNPYCKTPSGYVSGSNLNLLKRVLMYSNLDFPDYTIPLRLHVVAKSHKVQYGYSCGIYVTCDENLDLWRKITELDFVPDKILAIECNLYLFQYVRCYKLDLKDNKLILLRSFESCNFEVVKQEQLIYILLENNSERRYEVEIFDHEDNSWRNGVPCLNIKECRIASISGIIYLVGCMFDENTLTAQKYDTECDAWTVLPSPKSFSSRFDFEVVAYHEKLFVIGRSFSEDETARNLQNVEVFDPKSQEWMQVLSLPIFYDLPIFIVLNDKLVIYDYADNSHKKKLLWNDSQENWENPDELVSSIGFYWCKICELSDPESVQIMLKGHQSGELQRCLFE